MTRFRSLFFQSLNFGSAQSEAIKFCTFLFQNANLNLSLSFGQYPTLAPWWGYCGSAVVYPGKCGNVWNIPRRRKMASRECGSYQNLIHKM